MNRARYIVRLVSTKGSVRRIRLGRLWRFLFTEGAYYDRKRGTRTYHERVWA